MAKRTRQLTIALAAGCLLAAPATASFYTVTLTNGASFETRYEPVDAPWDEGKILIMTTFGNRVSLSRAEVASIERDEEAGRIGWISDRTTVDLGWTANDMPVGEAEAGLVGREPVGQPVHNVEQFVEPSEATGIPVWMIPQSTTPIHEPPSPDQ